MLTLRICFGTKGVTDIEYPSEAALTEAVERLKKAPTVTRLQLVSNALGAPVTLYKAMPHVLR